MHYESLLGIQCFFMDSILITYISYTTGCTQVSKTKMIYDTVIQSYKLPKVMLCCRDLPQCNNLTGVSIKLCAIMQERLEVDFPLFPFFLFILYWHFFFTVQNYLLKQRVSKWFLFSHFFAFFLLNCFFKKKTILIIVKQLSAIN